MNSQFANKLKDLMDEYAHLVYKVTKIFPKDEIYGITSQFRRASLSVILNYIEGYSRRKRLVMINFYEISYGSLKESEYLIKFTYLEGLLTKSDCDQLSKLSNEIGAMLWTTLENLKK